MERNDRTCRAGAAAAEACAIEGDSPKRIVAPVLVVDDNEHNRLALEAVLTAPGYRIVEAGSGREALQWLLEDEFAVILLDVFMPDMSGFELAAAIKGRKRTASVPILFLTARARELELVFAGYQAGAVDYLVKPLNADVVRAKVAIFAELYRQRKQIEHQADLLVEAERRAGAVRLMELKLAHAAEALRARDEFLSVASHELRTPLSSLQLQIQFLLQAPRSDPDGQPLSEATKVRLQMAERQVERMGRLIAELMDLSKITSGRLRLELTEVDLSELVADVVARSADEAARARISVRVETPTPVLGRWDRLRVEQVVINLLTNAIKFGAEKPVDVAVIEQGGVARLTVADHGVGIAPEDADRIFHRYEQAGAARAYGGLGLGLYIVRQIVEAHGGTIRVDSRPSHGSTFTVELPRAPTPAPAGASAA